MHVFSEWNVLPSITYVQIIVVATLSLLLAAPVQF